MFWTRPTTEADRPALSRLLASVWPENAGAVAYHGGGRLPGTVALLDDEIVGYAHATRKRLHPTHTYVGVHVAPACRRQGIGSALWEGVTKDLSGTLKTATDAKNAGAIAFLTKRGLGVSVETRQSRLELALLDSAKTQRWQAEAEALGFELRPMSTLSDPDLSDPDLDTLLTTLHRQVYAQTHLHDPPDTHLLDATDFLGDDLEPGWLFVARSGSQLAGVASVRRGDDTLRGDLGWCGVTAPFASAGRSVTLALAALALQAAKQGGVQEVSGEFDSPDADIMHLYSALPWQAKGLWLTLTTARP